MKNRKRRINGQLLPLKIRLTEAQKKRRKKIKEKYMSCSYCENRILPVNEECHNWGEKQ